MDYLVNIENTPYYQWQIELLIESFNEKNVAGNLCVVLPVLNNNDVINKYFYRNIAKHNRKVQFYNLGEKKGCVLLNKIYALQLALSNNLISQPFALIEADLVLKNHVPLTSNSGFPEFSFSMDPFFTLDLAEESMGPFWSWFGKDRSDIQTKWLSIGECYAFNGFPPYFFYKVVADAEELALRQMLEGKKVWEHTVKIAFILNIIDNFQNIRCQGDYGIVMPLMSSGETSFISYKTGFLPSFHKNMFQYVGNLSVSLGDPIEVLSQIHSSPNAEYVSHIAAQSISKRTG